MRTVAQKLFLASDVAKVEVRSVAFNEHYTMVDFKFKNDFAKVTFETNLHIDKIIEIFNKEKSKL